MGLCSAISASVKTNDPRALMVWYGLTWCCAATGRSCLMAETDKLQTSQASQRLLVGAIVSRSHTMSHAARPLCCYLSCAATCHLLHSGPWVMGWPRGRGLASLPLCGVKRAEQTDLQILHGRRTHRLDIWGQGRRQGLSGQTGVKKLRGPSVFTWGNHCFAPRRRWLLAESRVASKGTGYTVLALTEQVEKGCTTAFEVLETQSSNL